MEKEMFEKLHRINYLTAETNALYHQASLKLGISDSAMRVLYTIYDHGESCLLSDIYKLSDMNKQTVNSAIRKLEQAGIVFTLQNSGRTKKVCLTGQGKVTVEKTAARLAEMELSAFSSWTQDEINAYIGFMEKFVTCFRKQVKEI